MIVYLINYTVPAAAIRKSETFFGKDVKNIVEFQRGIRMNKSQVVMMKSETSGKTTKTTDFCETSAHTSRSNFS